MGKKKPRRPKHVPQRTCIACRQKVDKRRLTRIVRSNEEGVVVDPSGKRNGRGAYLCDQVVCWDRAFQNPQLLDQALLTTVTEEERAAIATFKPTMGEVTE
ncbi:MAG: YlxR family protein [Candidatus Promineifilaceae bacterium]|nr:YlxR family protein [Candidatus Promineifilaceae bacterium]